MTATASALLEQARSRVCSLSCREARAALGARVVIDVREPHEVLHGYLPEALNIPRGLLEFVVVTDPRLGAHDTPILVYSQLNRRALLAADTLQALGYTDVKALEGGFTRWIQAGYQVD